MAEIDLVHARIDGGKHLLGPFQLMGPLGHGRQGGDTDHRHAGTKGEPLGHADPDPYPGEGARPTTEGDGVELIQR